MRACDKGETVRQHERYSMFCTFPAYNWTSDSPFGSLLLFFSFLFFSLSLFTFIKHFVFSYCLVLLLSSIVPCFIDQRIQFNQYILYNYILLDLTHMFTLVFQAISIRHVWHVYVMHVTLYFLILSSSSLKLLCFFMKVSNNQDNLQKSCLFFTLNVGFVVGSHKGMIVISFLFFKYIITWGLFCWVKLLVKYNEMVMLIFMDLNFHACKTI